MEILMSTLLNGWISECGKKEPFPPPDFYAVIVTNPAQWHLRRIIEEGNVMVDDDARRVWFQRNPKLVVRVDESGALVVKRWGARYTEWTVLARHMGARNGEKEFVLLNGDGFEQEALTRLQAQVRGAVGVTWRLARQRMVVPFQALSAARIDFGSIEPIHISPDQNVAQTVQVPKPPADVLGKLPPVSKDWQDFSWNGNQYEYRLRPYYKPDLAMWRIMWRAEFAADPAWHEIADADAKQWWVREFQHRLGQAVFRATDPGGRHRWLSGFDQQENPPMYFLAQLPDRGGIRYVTHAVRALAPRIVQQARIDGRRVFRQGDIFAVETDLTDDDFGSRIVRRDMVLRSDSSLMPFAMTKQGRRIRRRLMIYGTGHTADYVAVMPHGTFVKGRLFHDPVLENVRGGREPEHRTIRLDWNAWFLCVRNTVPRVADGSSDST